MRWPMLLPSLLLTAACSDDGPSGGSDRLISAVGPSEVTGVPLDTLAELLVVQVTNRLGLPMPGIQVTWSTADGGSVVPESAETDQSGIVRAAWKLGSGVGQQAARASAGDGVEVTFTAEVDAFRAIGLSVGDAFHHCGIAPDDVLYCWGENDDGQLGDNSTTRSEVPVRVDLTETVRQVVTGEGSVGDIDELNRRGSLSRPASHPLTANDDYTCALTTAGDVWCWGGNDAAQLGIGTRLPSRFPTRPELPAGVYTSIAAYSGGACAVEQGGDAYCWGSNYEGRLGVGHRDLLQTAPARVVADFPWRLIALSDDRACGLREDGQVYCWGARPEWLGIDEDTATSVPLPVQNSPLMESVTMSGWHQCGITSGQSTYCWGANHNIGFDTSDEIIPYPTALDAPPAFRSLHSIFKPTFGLGTDGRGYWWGPPPRATGGGPVVPEVFSDDIILSAIGTYDDGPCGIEEGSGAVFCWGSLNGFDMDRVLAVPPTSVTE